jgi:hypothetical protein
LMNLILKYTNMVKHVFWILFSHSLNIDETVRVFADITVSVGKSGL